jgi:hypothetical protein
MVVLELEMLHQKGAIHSNLSQQIGELLWQFPMTVVMSSALLTKWTRDPGECLTRAQSGKGGRFDVAAKWYGIWYGDNEDHNNTSEGAGGGD